MTARVAMASGRRVADVLDEPWAFTLWTYTQLDECDHIDALQRRGERLHMASLMVSAYHKPALLGDEDDAFRRDAGLLRPPKSREEQARESAAFLEQFQKTTVTETIDPADPAAFARALGLVTVH